MTVIGVDLGATNIRAATVAEDGRCGRALTRRLTRGSSPREVAVAAAALCREAADGEALEAVGVGLAGWLDEATGVVHNGPNLGWQDVPFGALLAEALAGPLVALTNDLRAIAWGEHLHGAGAGAELLLVVFQGSGIGSSVIVEGRQLRGASGISCEIGHLRVVPRGGRACCCGQLGCLEAYVGGHNLERRARQDLSTGVRTKLLDLAGGDPDAVTCATVEQAARLGDRYARELWEEAAGHLAQALGSLVTYLNPDRLILGGGVWQGSPTLRALTLERLPYATSELALARCQLVEPSLGERAGIIGAASMAYDRILSREGRLRSRAERLRG